MPNNNDPRRVPVSAEEAPVKSPCISVCCLDAQDVCTGCYRTASEIRDWLTLDNRGKRKVLKSAHARYQASGKAGWL